MKADPLLQLAFAQLDLGHGCEVDEYLRRLVSKRFSWPGTHLRAGERAGVALPSS